MIRQVDREATEREMSDNEPFSPLLYHESLQLHYHSPSTIFSKTEMFLFYRYFSIDYFLQYPIE